MWCYDSCYNVDSHAILRIFTTIYHSSHHKPKTFFVPIWPSHHFRVLHVSTTANKRGLFWSNNKSLNVHNKLICWFDPLQHNWAKHRLSFAQEVDNVHCMRVNLMDLPIQLQDKQRRCQSRSSFFSSYASKFDNEIWRPLH